MSLIQKNNDAEAIRSLLPESLDFIEIISAREVSSTNDEAKKLSDRYDTLVYIADSQTKGRGRMGRKFFSPEGTGIYMSILLHPSLDAEDCTLLTPLCAVALTKAIEKVLSIKTGIKWVNDIYLGNKKVAGILTEGSFRNGKADYVIVGAGINLTKPKDDFPEEIRDIAASLTSDGGDLRNQLIAEIITSFMELYRQLPEKVFLNEYRKRLLYLGEEIRVISSEGTYKAVAEDIDGMCRLIVRLPDSEKRTLYEGEISIRPD